MRMRMGRGRRRRSGMRRSWVLRRGCDDWMRLCRRRGSKERVGLAGSSNFMERNATLNTTHDHFHPQIATVRQTERWAHKILNAAGPHVDTGMPKHKKSQKLKKP
jgi:hypothetical protein